MKKPIVIVLISLIIIGGVNVLCASGNFEEISLSVLAEKIQQEKVESITIKGDNIEAVLKDGTVLHSKKEMEHSLTKSLLNYGVSAKKLSKVDVKVEREKFPVALKLFLPFLVPILVFGVWFLIFYFLILLGFRILKIKGIPRSKITVYVFVMFLLGLFLNSAVLAVFESVSNRIILYFTSVLISFLVVFLLLKYYFLLSGKKLWQFLLYLVVLSFILSTVVTIFINIF